MKVTLLKPYRKTETVKRVELEEVVRMIADCDTIDEVHRIRQYYHLMNPHRHDDGQVSTNFAGGVGLPRVCFSSEFENRNKEHHLIAYTGLAVVEVNNLATIDEAIAIREAAKRMPQTMLCFLGGSGRSVKIVCRGQSVPAKAIPTEAGEIETFHRQLYQMALDGSSIEDRHLFVAVRVAEENGFLFGVQGDDIHISVLDRVSDAALKRADIIIFKGNHDVIVVIDKAEFSALADRCIREGNSNRTYIIISDDAPSAAINKIQAYSEHRVISLNVKAGDKA